MAVVPSPAATVSAGPSASYGTPKDPQRIVNLTVSNIAELTTQIPRTKWAVGEGQLAGHEDEWNPNDRASISSTSFTTPWAGSCRPLRPTSWSPRYRPSAYSWGRAIDATKTATKHLPMRPSAIGVMRQRQGSQRPERSNPDSANFHFHDNEARTRRSIGKILVELIRCWTRARAEVPVMDIDGRPGRCLSSAVQPTEMGKQSIVNRATGPTSWLSAPARATTASASRPTTRTARSPQGPELHGGRRRHHVPQHGRGPAPTR